MISVIWNSDSVIAGRISALSPLFVRRPVVHQPRRNGLASPERGQPPEQNREHEDQQDADQERRQADADQRGRQQQLREPARASQRRVDAERDADAKREDRGGRGELDRRRQPLLEQRRHRPALPQRNAELALRRVADEARELHDRRLIEAKLVRSRAFSSTVAS
jgi:hypothetical protein